MARVDSNVLIDNGAIAVNRRFEVGGGSGNVVSVDIVV